ncbi:hypothetical protein BDZ97DRAFT_423922 [Flammula alnicola]|nr:hypothetical protein BDZ97DRAFT_423922 [Flammula alnicola]
MDKTVKAPCASRDSEASKCITNLSLKVRQTCKRTFGCRRMSCQERCATLRKCVAQNPYAQH